MFNIDFEDPRIVFDRYYYLDNDTLQSVERNDVELEVTYFVITQTRPTDNDPRFMFGKFEDISGYYNFKPFIDSTDWHYYPYFLKRNVMEKLKELTDNEKEDITVRY